MRLRLPRGRHLDIARPPAVMGILNITPDSFSDGGVHFDHTKAVHAAMQMEEDGAAVVDVGGESTRPGSAPVSVEQEIARVVPVIAQIRARSEVAISIDTRKAAVARAALEAGADMINDVSGLRHDPLLTDVAREAGVPVIVMHMRGEPATMQQLAVYDDVVADVARELRERLDAAAGLEQVLIDPGIGFAKTFEHNLELLARCNELTAIAPVVIGASRKAFIGHITGRDAGPERAVGSLAAVAAAHRGGATMVRVHDVRQTMDFLRVLQAIEERRRA
ncbi:MAG TPA: dihydropteroate synthase [Thermoanaerobaculia bacterium]|nr:dihydropteroate synthase [Thermoanaerobaculia bacterium]